MRKVVSRASATLQLHTGPVDVLVADPPWKFGDSIQGARGASHKYPCLSVDKIARFNIPAVADHAMLFLWRVAAMPEEALFVCRAWGFKPYSEIVWVKTTEHDKLHFGMGHVVRAAHEVCLIGVRGRRIPPDAAERSEFFGKVRAHSEKPEEFYQLVNRLYARERKHEMFARRTRSGWTQEGNQLGILDEEGTDAERT